MSPHRFEILTNVINSVQKENWEMKKRRVLSVLLLIIMLAFTMNAQATESPQVPIAGSSIPQFAQALPLLDIGGAAHAGIFATLGNRPLTIRMCEFKSRVLPSGAVDSYGGTWVWGYLVDPTGTSTCASLVYQYSNGT